MKGKTKFIRGPSLIPEEKRAVSIIYNMFKFYRLKGKKRHSQISKE